MAGPRPRSRGVTLVPPPWADLLYSALGGVYPAEHRLDDLIDLLEARK